MSCLDGRDISDFYFPLKVAEVFQRTKDSWFILYSDIVNYFQTTGQYEITVTRHVYLAFTTHLLP